MTQRAMEAFARNLWGNWKTRDEFVKAQKHVAGILALAWIGNNWPASYPRDENENAAMFWVMNVALLVAALVTIQHDANGSARGIQLLSRDQTEEWKGWMQWAFIMVNSLLQMIFFCCSHSDESLYWKISVSLFQGSLCL